MDSPTPLDALLPQPAAQRALGVLLRHALFHQTYGFFAAVGPSRGAALAVAALHQAHPNVHGHRHLIQTAPMRLTSGSKDPRTLEMGVTDVVRALLRQDPDALALDHVEPGVGPLLLQAALTGHQVIIGVEGIGASDVVDALMHGSDGTLPRSMWEDTVGWVVELTDTAAGPTIQRVLHRARGAFVEVASLTGATLVIHRDRLPWPESPSAPPPGEPTPPLAPPLASRAAPRWAPRTAHVPRTSPEATPPGPHRIHGSTVLWPATQSWPSCRACSAPLVHVVQLDLSALPAPALRRSGVVQLFVCAQGCDTTSETAPGVVALTLDAAACVECPCPVGPREDVLASGTVVGWDRVEEEPSLEDAEGMGLGPPSLPTETDGEPEDPRARGPLSCDKVGGWPAWQQGPQWPSDSRDQVVLFQWVEGAPRVGPAEPRFDDATGTLKEPVPAVSIMDPNEPRRFQLLSGEASAFLFMNVHTGALAFRWQTG